MSLLGCSRHKNAKTANRLKGMKLWYCIHLKITFTYTIRQPHLILYIPADRRPRGSLERMRLKKYCFQPLPASTLNVWSCVLKWEGVTQRVWEPQTVMNKGWERGWRMKSFQRERERCTREREETERVIVRYWNTSTEGRYKREGEEREEDELKLKAHKEGPCRGGRGAYPSVDLDGTLVMWNSISCQLCGNVCQMPCVREGPWCAHRGLFTVVSVLAWAVLNLHSFAL